MLDQKNYDFSFSGLKTSVLYYLKEHRPLINADINADKRGYKISRNWRKDLSETPYPADVAASFQAAAIDVLVAKTMRAAKEYKVKSVMLSGGVAANRKLRGDMRQATRKMGLRFFVPDFKYNLDNAAMIAAAGYMAHLRKKKYKLTARGNLKI